MSERKVPIVSVRASVVLSVAFAACNGGSNPTPILRSDAGTEASAADAAGAPAESAPPRDSGPAREAPAPLSELDPVADPAVLVNRLADTNVDCRVVRPATLLGTALSWQGVLLPTAGGAAIASVEVFISDLISGMPPESGVNWSSIDAAGVRGPNVPVERDETVRLLAASARGARSTMVWTRDVGAEPELMLAQVDSDDVNSANLVQQARSISSPDGGDSDPRLVATSTGYALLWNHENGTADELRLSWLDEQGQGTASTLVVSPTSGAGYVVPSGLAVLGSSVVATYYDGTSYHAAVLAQGAESAPTSLPILAPYFNSVLPRGDRALAAWSARHVGPATPRGESSESYAYTIRLGWFDPSTARPLGSAHDFAAPVWDQENVDPVLIDLGDDIGLLWSQGSVIYICGGCTPDNSLKFVVLDGETLAPKSQILTLTNPASDGGLTHPQIARVGSDLLVIADVEYHTTQEGASATLRCEL